MIKSENDDIVRRRVMKTFTLESWLLWRVQIEDNKASYYNDKIYSSKP